jgi:chromosome partitioning protein
MQPSSAHNNSIKPVSRNHRYERLLKIARSVIEEAGFDVLDNIWPERDGFQSDLDRGRAGSETHNPHLREAALGIEANLLALALGHKA